MPVHPVIPPFGRKGRPRPSDFRDGSYDDEEEAEEEDADGMEDDGVARAGMKKVRRGSGEMEGFGGYGVGVGTAIAGKAGPSGHLGQCRTSPALCQVPSNFPLLILCPFLLLIW